MEYRYRFECAHEPYSDSELESERFYRESKEYDLSLAKYLREKIPYIADVTVSVSVYYNEVMIDTNEKLTDADMEYLCKSSTLGGYRTICTSEWCN